jgi:hypothetical protein
MDSKSVDITPIQVGYVNLDKGAVYLARVAKRRWKQGLDKRSLCAVGFGNIEEDGWFFTNAMYRCLTNRYPSLEGAILEAKTRGIHVAYHRDWAVSPNGRLYYKGKVVGTVADGCKLTEVFNYLKESLGESYERS